VVDAKASGRLSGKADIELQLTSINGTPVITSTVGSTGKGHKGATRKPSAVVRRRAQSLAHWRAVAEARRLVQEQRCGGHGRRCRNGQEERQFPRGIDPDLHDPLMRCQR